MKNLFKVFIVIAIVSTFSFTEAKAQISVGGGLVFGTRINTIGITANGKYEFTEDWSAAPAFTYFIPKDGFTWMALDLDANYKITQFEGIGGLYGIGGLGMTFAHYKVEADLGEFGSYSASGTSTSAGLNLGAGLEIPLSEKMAVSPEMKITIGNGSYFRIGAKIMFGL
ncbi:MAG: outer membrane beta-barrel protein [Draconibacterium sp.]|nr:outer membrane beta-barrel protein [Draconibacterium sp.]